jgi:hypothetical protein
VSSVLLPRNATLNDLNRVVIGCAGGGLYAVRVADPEEANTALQAAACFLIPSIMFMLKTQEKRWKPEPRVLGRWTGFWSIIGSVGFEYAFTAPLPRCPCVDRLHANYLKALCWVRSSYSS